MSIKFSLLILLGSFFISSCLSNVEEPNTTPTGAPPAYSDVIIHQPTPATTVNQPISQEEPNNLCSSCKAHCIKYKYCYTIAGVSILTLTLSGGLATGCVYCCICCQASYC